MLLILPKVDWIKLGLVAIATCYICVISALIPSVNARSPDWVINSNQFSDLLSTAIAAEDCQPEPAVSESLLEVDPTFRECREQSILQAVQTLENKQTQVRNADLRLDLEILLKFGRQRLRSYDLDEKYRLPYVDLSAAILDTLESTLNETKSTSKVLAQLKQYAGIEPGKIALADSLRQAIKIQLQKSEVVFPNRYRLKNDLKNNASQVYKIQAFLEQQKVPDYEEAYTKLKKQLFAYETFIRREVLSKTKKNFPLPAELYVFELQEQGIETPIEQVMEQAHVAFIKIQQQMQAISPKIAKKNGLKANDYRDVIQALQQEQLSADETLRLYQNRAQDIAEIIQREDIVTLPEDKFNIRLATVRENKNFPVPLYDPGSSTFVIPALRDPQKAKLYNDFTNPAMSWTLTAHEGRPGHDLQFATINNQNLSEARTDFASNATNIEGWATYAEKILLPYMPLEGQFMSLQFQLLRAARAFLEPELQLGKITKENALKIITEDAGFSEFFAKQEIKRYTQTFVGQAPSYFYGSQQFLELRSQAEKMQGEKFDPQEFHDFVLSKGYITPKLLEQVLITDY